MAIFLRVAPSAWYRLEGATREHETFQTPIFSTRYFVLFQFPFVHNRDFPVVRQVGLFIRNRKCPLRLILILDTDSTHLAANAGVGGLPVVHGDVAAVEGDLLVLPVHPGKGNQNEQMSAVPFSGERTPLEDRV